MEALLAKLKELESQLSKLEEANAHDEQMKEALELKIKERSEQVKSLADVIKMYKEAVNELQETRKGIEEAFSSLYIAHTTGGATEADFKSFAGAAGLGFPPTSNENIEPETIAQTG